MYRGLILGALVMNTAACSATANDVAAQSSQQHTEQTCQSEGFIKSLKLANGASVVVEEGRLEPRSIGSVTVKLYSDLYSGEFIGAVSFPRDGGITQAILVENGDDKQQLSVTMASAGSGNYQSNQQICLTKNSIKLC